MKLSELTEAEQLRELSDAVTEGELATDADWDRMDARQSGEEHPERAWVLTDRDVWHPNPYYKGPPEPHPEDEPPEEFRGGGEWTDPAKDHPYADDYPQHSVGDDEVRPPIGIDDEIPFEEDSTRMGGPDYRIEVVSVDDTFQGDTSDLDAVTKHAIEMYGNDHSFNIVDHETDEVVFSA